MTITAISTATPPQRWACPLCGLRYQSPLLLAHPPNHRCAVKHRILKMEVES